MKHTPGPWIIDPAEDLPLAVIQDVPNGYGIAEIYRANINNIATAKANAALIAAAPDMLEALEAITKLFQTEYFPAFNENLHIVGQANKAITKAKGT